MKRFERINHFEVHKYIEKMNNGDLDARDKVIYHYSNQINRIIKNNYNSEKYNKEDLFQAGIIGLIIALNKNYDKDCQYISRRINYFVTREIEKFINSENKVNPELKPKFNIQPIEYVEDKQNLILSLEIIEHFPKKEKEIFYLYFYNDYSLDQIAEIYSLTKQRIYEILIERSAYIKQQILIKEICLWDHETALKHFNSHLDKNINIDIIEYINKNKSILLEIVQELPEKKRNILLFYFYENYSIEKISKLYMLSENKTQEIINKGILFIKQKIFFNKIKDKNHQIAMQNFNKHLTIQDDNDIIQYMDDDKNSILIYKAIKRFFNREKYILYLYFYENYSIKDIAKLYNITENKAENLFNKGLLFIKQYISYNMNKDKENIKIKK